MTVVDKDYTTSTSPVAHWIKHASRAFDPATGLLRSPDYSKLEEFGVSYIHRHSLLVEDTAATRVEVARLAALRDAGTQTDPVSSEPVAERLSAQTRNLEVMQAQRRQMADLHNRVRSSQDNLAAAEIAAWKQAVETQIASKWLVVNSVPPAVTDTATMQKNESAAAAERRWHAAWLAHQEPGRAAFDEALIRLGHDPTPTKWVEPAGRESVVIRAYDVWKLVAPVDKITGIPAVMQTAADALVTAGSLSEVTE